MTQFQIIRSRLVTLINALLFPAVPTHIQAAFERAQLTRVLRHIPMIYAVGILNLSIVITVCVHYDFPFSSYAWMGVIVCFATFRMIVWMRRSKIDPEILNARKVIRSMTLIAIGVMGAMSAWTSWSFLSGLFGPAILTPISLTFGATCIAHCLAPLRTAAVGTLAVGVIPIASVMTLTGNFEARLLGICIISIAALMIRFVIEQYEQMVVSLLLEQQIRDLANTDSLTGLSNRRAIMEALEVELASGKPFGVALLDLDGFKEVNDELGHHAGDELLRHVASRLSAAAGPADTVGRLGGDEFIVMFRNILSEEEISARTTALLAGLCKPAIVADTQVPIAASLGHALFPNDGASVADILIVADRALYVAKKSGNDAMQAPSERRDLVA
jgi:diguanylate cyclase